MSESLVGWDGRPIPRRLAGFIRLETTNTESGYDPSDAVGCNTLEPSLYECDEPIVIVSEDK